MNSLERTLLEKSGYDNGWEATPRYNAANDSVILASVRHDAVAEVSGGAPFTVRFAEGPTSLPREVARAMNWGDATTFTVPNLSDLSTLLRQAASLAMSLPRNAEDEYVRRSEKLLKQVEQTEVERLVRQRVGQDVFREALLNYWGGACAVTGIAVPEILRASHAKPWADCESNAERLDVFNGLLLCAHLDALFDRGLIAFDDDGAMCVSKRIDEETRMKLGLDAGLKTRWLADEHRIYLAWHREKIYVDPCTDVPEGT